MSATVLISDACDGCGICVDSCPVDVLRLDPATNRATAVWPRDCQACFLCHNDCPKGAITIEKGAATIRRRSIYDTLGFSEEALVFGGE